MEDRWYIVEEPSGRIRPLAFTKFHPAVGSPLPINRPEHQELGDCMVLAAVDEQAFQFLAFANDDYNLKVVLALLRAGVRAGICKVRLGNRCPECSPKPEQHGTMPRLAELVEAREHELNQTHYHWTDFELLEGQTHADASRWFDKHGYRNMRHHRDAPIHTVHMDGIAGDVLRALVAEADCPVKWPASASAVEAARQLAHFGGETGYTGI